MPYLTRNARGSARYEDPTRTEARLWRVLPFVMVREDRKLPCHAWPQPPGPSPTSAPPPSGPRASWRPPPPRRKDAALARLAELLGERSDEILEANAADLADERAAGLTDALRDRLALDEERVASMAAGVRAIAALPDPVGEVIEERTLASGLRMKKVRVPLGVIAVVYEARPNVTVDCAALTLKSGNAIVLRGSSYAARSNGALAAVVREAVAEAGLPEGSVELLDGGDRAELAELATRRGPGGPGHPAGRRGSEGGAEVGGDGAGDVRGGGQLPRLRARGRRSGDGARGRLQRQGPAPGRLQRGRDPAGQRPRRRAVPARGAGGPARRGGRAGGRRAGARGGGRDAGWRRHRRRLGHRVPGHEDGGRRGRLARTTRSRTSTGTAPATRRRS